MPARPMHNLIILTHGWTGSSVFAGLAAAGGAWLGDQTMLKPDYDTHENAELVELNRRLLQDLAPGLNHEHAFSAQQVLAIARRAETMDLTPYRDFVDRCNQHRPWVWKDPRLTWTIRVWARLLDLRDLRFLVLTREPLQAWITANLRRHVQSFGFTSDYNGGITRANLDFVTEAGCTPLTMSFEDLLLQPEASLARLNALLDSQLTMQDLKSVCNLPLGRRSRNLKDFALASLIYLRNHHERDGRGRAVRASA